MSLTFLHPHVAKLEVSCCRERALAPNWTRQRDYNKLSRKPGFIHFPLLRSAPLSILFLILSSSLVLTATQGTSDSQVMHAIANGATIFRPAFPGQPVATWLLIENTQSMFSCWADLRNRYLPNIVGSIRAANPGVPVRTPI